MKAGHAVNAPAVADPWRRIDVSERTCSVDGCEYPSRARGWCTMHYQRWQDHGSVGGPQPLLQLNPPETCTVEGCSNRQRVLGYCSMHYSRWRKHGDVGPPFPLRQWHGTDPCSVRGCSRQRYGRDLCQLHWRRLRDRGEVGAPLPKPKASPGDRFVTDEGYIRVFMPGHPTAPRNGWVGEHRAVMSDSLGRPLSRQEQVHHRNGIRHDNRLANLELWDTSHPAGQRVPDLLEFYSDLLTRTVPHHQVLLTQAQKTRLSSVLATALDQLNP